MTWAVMCECSGTVRDARLARGILKYFLMGAFSTGIMLMGIAFIYGANPNASFFINNIVMGTGKLAVMMAVGLVLLLISLAFKVSAAPFQFWTADVYDGAPTVFTSFMATIVKVAAFFAFIRLFENAFGRIHAQWQVLIVVITIATLLIGNITAVFQQSVKRMLAYSSIAQAGFMLLALFALNDKAKEGLILYSAAYSLATIGFFAILIKTSDYTIEGFNGLGKTQPVLGLTATIFLLSLTGIPLTAGFQSKFYMLLAAVQNGHHFWIVIAAVLFAAISAYYYFRVIQAIWFKPAQDENSLIRYEMEVTPGVAVRSRLLPPPLVSGHIPWCVSEYEGIVAIARHCRQGSRAAPHECLSVDLFAFLRADVYRTAKACWLPSPMSLAPAAWVPPSSSARSSISSS